MRKEITEITLPLSDLAALEDEVALVKKENAALQARVEELEELVKVEIESVVENCPDHSDEFTTYCSTCKYACFVKDAMKVLKRGRK